MRFLLIGLVLFLSGCSATMVPVITKSVDEAGNVITKTTPYLTEASVAKSSAFYDMYSVRDTVTMKMFEMSGVRLEIDDNGKISAITIRGNMPAMEDLPDKVDEYPAWGVVESLGTVLIKSVLMGYGINQMTGMVSGLAATGGTTYNGNFTATNSLNTSTGSQTFDYSYAPITGK